MKQYILLLTLTLLTACVTTELQIEEDPKTKAKNAEKKQIQRDIRHNKCVSHGNVVGSEEYDKCMAENS